MNFENARANMLKQQIRTWGITNTDILDIIARTPREDFVPAEYRHLAFVDSTIALPHNQVMLNPCIEARILQELHITDDENILVIGTGSGYLSALLAKCGAHVYSIDVHAQFTEHAQQQLLKHNINNVSCITGDAIFGWETHAPYDVIVVTGSVAFIPEQLTKQLTTGGRLFAIIGNSPNMTATIIERVEANKWQTNTLFETDIPRLTNAPQEKVFTF